MNYIMHYTNVKYTVQYNTTEMHSHYGKIFFFLEESVSCTLHTLIQVRGSDKRHAVISATGTGMTQIGRRASALYRLLLTLS